MTSEKYCRWGIMGTAGISRKNWMAIRLSNNGRVTAVASRTENSAKQFIDECSEQVPPETKPAGLGSYQEVLERDDVDAVYIPLPTAMRHEWVIKAAEAGKHVLGEKPAAVDANQVQEMLAACKANGVQYMDGVMFMHSDRLGLLRSVLDDPEQIGTVRRLASQFSFAGDEDFQSSNIRTDSRLEPYGCLGDLGWYCVRMFLWLRQGMLPIEVRARILSTLQGRESPGCVPGQFSAELLFADGVSATFYNSFVTENQQWIHVSGSAGNLSVEDFVLPYCGPEDDVKVNRDVYTVDNCQFHMEHHSERHSIREYDANHQTAQEVKMFQNFSNLVLSRKVDEQWHRWTLNTQLVLDACFQSATQDGSSVKLSV